MPSIPTLSTPFAHAAQVTPRKQGPRVSALSARAGGGDYSVLHSQLNTVDCLYEGAFAICRLLTYAPDGQAKMDEPATTMPPLITSRL